MQNKKQIAEYRIKKKIQNTEYIIQNENENCRM